MRKNALNPMPADWNAIRAAVLQRAAGHCEFCGVKEGTLRATRAVELVTTADAAQLPLWGVPAPGPATSIKVVRVVLSVAHLRHDRDDKDLRWIRALCVVCHFRHDGTTRRLHKHVLARKAGQQYLPGLVEHCEPHLCETYDTHLQCDHAERDWCCDVLSPGDVVSRR